MSLRFLCLLYRNGSVAYGWQKPHCHSIDYLDSQITMFYHFIQLHFLFFFLVPFENETLDVEWQMVATGSVVVVKFCLAITFFVINLQAMETYPTCLRQTGLSIGIMGSNIIGILGPYIVYLVSVWNVILFKKKKKQFSVSFYLANNASGRASGRPIGMVVQLKVSGIESVSEEMLENHRNISFGLI